MLIEMYIPVNIVGSSGERQRELLKTASLVNDLVKKCMTWFYL